MQIKCVTKDNKFRLAFYSSFQLFNLISFVYFLIACIRGDAVVTQVVMCVASMIFVSIPDIAQKLFKFKMATPMYIFCMCYALCPMLGHTYGLYYYIAWWDKLLHLTGGVVFALLGAYLPKLFLKNEDCSIWLCAFVGVLFSVTVSVAWEFVEYFMDSVFLTDMQKDVWLGEVNSYLLNDLLGGNVGDILRTDGVATIVNGEYVLNGYIDVGRTDTMHDMLIETIGALVYSIVYVLDKGKHTAFHLLSAQKRDAEKTEEKELEKEVAQTRVDE